MKNFSYAFMANVVTMLISVIMTLFLPRILGVVEYSYWQLYLFYGTYIMYSSLGWCDGLYLKYGGKEYSQLNPGMISAQFWYLAIYETLFGILFSGILMFAVKGIDKRFVIVLSFISTVINILRYMLQYILEATNRIREYSTIIITERLLFVAAVGFCWLAHIGDYRFLIYAEVAARLIATLVGIFYCRQVVFSHFVPVRAALFETKELILGGYKLLCANLTSQLVIGIVRFAIENKWGTVRFGKVSLTLSMSNMLITCISAVGIVLFPALRRTDREKLPQIYKIIRTAIAVPSLAVLMFYMPIKLILSLWLPQYAESLKYLAILLPMCVFEGRTQLLIHTYLKTLRKEKLILQVNILTVLLSLITTGISVYGIGNMDVAVAAIIVMLIFKCFVAETLLSKLIDIRVHKDLFLEIALTAVFIYGSWVLGGIPGLLIYIAAYVLYLFIQKNTIKEAFVLAKAMIKSH